MYPNYYHYYYFSAFDSFTQLLNCSTAVVQMGVHFLHFHKNPNSNLLQECY